MKHRRQTRARTAAKTVRQKKTARLANDERLRALTENALDLIVVLNADGAIQFVSPSLERVLGYKAAEVTGKSFLQFVHPENLPKATSAFSHRLKTPGLAPAPIEIRARHRDGGWRDVEVLGNNLLDQPAVAGMVLNVRDITERQRAENEIAWLASFPARNPNPVVEVDSSGTIRYMNPAAQRMFPELPVSRFEHSWLAGLDSVIAQFKREGAGSLRREIKIGDSWYSQPVYYVPEGECLRVYGNDITERKRAEEILRESEARYRDLIEYSQDLFCTHDLQGKILSINPAVSKILGYAPDEMLGRYLREFLVPEASGNFDTYLAQIQAQGSAKGLMVVQTRAGEARIWEYNNTLRVEGTPEPIVRGMARDVTERVRAEKLLRASEEQYRQLFDNANDIVYTHDLAGNFTSLNKAGERISGYPLEEALKLNIAQIVAPAYLARIREVLSPTGIGTGPTIHELEIITKSGQRVSLELSTRLIFQGGKPIAVHGIARDISERKRAADTLRESQAQLTAMIESAMDAIITTNEEQQIVLFNAAAEKMFGISAAQAIGQPLTHLMPPRHRESHPEYLRAFGESGATRRHMGRVEAQTISGLRAHGEEFPMEISISRAEIGGKKFYTAIARDISERQRSEEIRREGEAQYRTLFESSPVGIGVADQHGNLLTFNDAMLKPGGYTRQDIEAIGNVAGLYYDPAERTQALELASRRGFLNQQPVRFKRKDGTPYDALISLTPIQIKGAPGWQAVVEDVTDRKRAEEALRRSEAELRALFASMSDVVLVLDDQGRYLQIVPTDLSLLYKPSTELLGKRLHEIFPKDQADEYLRHIQSALQKQQTVNAEYALGIGDKQFWFSAAISPMTENSVLWVARDITERKRAEEESHRRADQFAALYETTRDLANLQDLPILLQTIITRAIQLLQVPNGTICLLDKERADLEIVATHGTELPVGARFKLSEGVAGQAAQTRKPVVVADYSSWEHRILTYVGASFTAAVAVPLLYGGELIGTLDLILNEPSTRKFSDEDVRLLTLFGGQVASAVHNARLLDETKRRANESAALYETTRDLAAAQDLPALLESILDRAVRLLRASDGTLYLFDEARNDLEVAATKLAMVPVGTRLPISEGASGHAIRTRQPLLIEDYRHWEHARSQYQGVDIRAVVQAPLIYAGKVIGVLGIAEIGNDRKFSETDLHLLESFSALAASAVYNARLLNETKRRAEEFAALYATTRDLSAVQDPAVLLQTIVERAQKLLAAGNCAIYLYDPARGDVELHAQTGVTVPVGARLQLGEGMGGRVALLREPLMVEDYQKWEFRSPQFNPIPFRAVVGVPMLYGGVLIGSLVLSHMGEETRQFSESEVRLLTLFASQAASAVHDARLLDETRVRATQLGLAYDAALALNSQLDPRVQLEFLFQIAMRALHAEFAAFFSHDPRNSQVALEMALGFEVTPDLLQTLRFQVGEERGLVGKVAQTRLPLYLPDAATDPRWIALEPRVRSVMWVPVQHEKELLGVLSISSNRVDAFTPQDQRLLVLFANQVAVAMQNAQLYRAARDSAERRTILHGATQEIARASLDREKIYVAIHQAATKLMPSEAFVIVLRDEVHNENVGVYLIDRSGRQPVLRMPAEGGLAGRVIQSGESARADDLAQLSEIDVQHFGDAASVRSVLAVPMRLGDRVVGMLSAQSYAARAYTEEDQVLLELLAAHAATAIENTRLFEETRRRALREEALRKTSATLAQLNTVPELCNAVARGVDETLGYKYFGIFLIDPQTGDRVLQAQSGWEDAQKNWRIASGEGLSHKAVVTGELQYYPDVTREPNYLPGLRGSHTEVDVPFKIGGKVVGVLVAEDLTVDAFDVEDFNVLQSVANQLAVALDNARLFSETQQRLSELEAVNRISTALRAAQTLDEMLPRLLDETLAALDTTAGNIWLYDPAKNQLLSAIGRGWVSAIVPPAAPREGIVGHVFATGQPHISREVKEDPRLRDAVRPLVPAGWGSAAVPIRSSQEIVGVIFVSVPLPRELAQAEVHLLSTLAEIAGNAIHRTRLNEQTERRLGHLQALREVDAAITGSLDLKLVLRILLEKVTTELRVDAASILLLNPHTHMLEYAAGLGFRSNAIERTSLRLGEGVAGRAALERRTLSANLLDPASGYARAALLKGEGFAAYYGVPLLAKGNTNGVMDIFSRVSLNPDRDWFDFLEALAGQAAIAIDSASLFADLEKSNLGLGLAYETTLEGWSRALDLRDKEIVGHTQRVTETTLDLAHAIGMNDADLAHVRRGALLHDIGKMGIPDAILLKPGALTDAEWEIMRQHPVLAYDLLAPISYLKPALDIPYCHHEKWDGTGYPRGLKGNQIPLSARIFAVADVYDALTSDRPYREAWSKARVIEYIRELAGKQFDPRVVEIFLSLKAEN